MSKPPICLSVPNQCAADGCPSKGKCCCCSGYFNLSTGLCAKPGGFNTPCPLPLPGCGGYKEGFHNPANMPKSYTHLPTACKACGSDVCGLGGNFYCQDQYDNYVIKHGGGFGAICVPADCSGGYHVLNPYGNSQEYYHNPSLQDVVTGFTPSAHVGVL